MGKDVLQETSVSAGVVPWANTRVSWPYCLAIWMNSPITCPVKGIQLNLSLIFPKSSSFDFPPIICDLLCSFQLLSGYLTFAQLSTASFSLQTCLHPFPAVMTVSVPCLLIILSLNCLDWSLLDSSFLRIEYFILSSFTLGTTYCSSFLRRCLAGKVQ